MAVIAGSLIKLTKYNATAGYQIGMICHHDEVVKFDSIVITQNDSFSDAQIDGALGCAN